MADFYDPISDIQTQWSTTGPNHFSVIDDAIRNPNVPTLTDYVSTNSNNAIDEWGFAPVTGSPPEIVAWLYAETQSKSTIVVSFQQGGVERATITIPINSTKKWYQCAWNAPSGDLSTLTIEVKQVKQGTGAGTYAYIYAAYLRAGPNLDKQVAATYDDATEYGDGSFYNAYQYIYVYSNTNPSSSSYRCCGVRFQQIDIAQGVTVDVATSDIWPVSPTYDDANMQIHLEAVDDAIDFNDNQDVISRVRTENFGAWVADSLGYDTWITSADFAAAAEEVFARAGWAANQDLVVLYIGKTDVNKSLYFRSYDYAGNLHGPKLHIEYTAGAPPQTISGAGGIGSQEAFGTAMVALAIAASSILSGEAFGTPALVYDQILSPTAIVSQETWGTPDIELTIAPSGIASGETWGTPDVLPGPVTLEPSGIGTAEAFGQPTILPGPVTVEPTGIASGEALGQPTVLPGSVTLQPGGISSAETFGSPSLTLIVEPSGIASGEALGSPTVVPGAVTLEPSGITSQEAFGQPTVVLAGAPITLEPSGIASGEAFGTPSVLPGTVTVEPTGITSAEAFGSPELTLTIEPTGIASGEAFGNPTVLPGPVTLQPDGIASEEAFGQPTVILTGGPITLIPVGITSGEAFGQPVLIIEQFIEPTGIPSAETFGTPQLTIHIEPSGIPSEEALGQPALTLVIRPVGIPSEEAFGSPTVVLVLTIIEPSGISSGETFGPATRIIGGETPHPPGYGPFYGMPKRDILDGTAKRDVLHGTPKRSVLHGTPRRER